MSDNKNLRQSKIRSFFSPATPKTEQASGTVPSQLVAPGSSGKNNTASSENSPASGNQAKRDTGGRKTPLKATNKRRRVRISSGGEDEKIHKRPRLNPEDDEDYGFERLFIDIPDARKNELLDGLNDKEKAIASNVIHAVAQIKSFAASPKDFLPPEPGSLEAELEDDLEAGSSTPWKEVGAQPKKSTSSEGFLHLRDPAFAFLKPENLRDWQGLKKSHPEYDPTTVLVPIEFMQSQTPGHKQWWKMKSQHFDTVLLFKVGKFYELYHMDAVIGVECLNLIYMRGKYAHAGFPEVAYGRYADQLVSRGYKVARIEQTETPKQMEERCKTLKVKDKVVRREVCRLTTQATRTYGVLDTANETNSLEFVDSSAKFLIAISEKVVKSQTSNVSVSDYGVCITDTTTGAFILSQFTDDQCHSYLRTLLAQHPPLQVVYEKGQASSSTLAILNSVVGHCQKEGLAPSTQFWPASKTLEILGGDDYLGSVWPDVLLNLLEDKPTSGGLARCKPRYSMVFSALGAILWYLKRCLIDVDLVTIRNFDLYDPIGASKKNTSGYSYWQDRNMVLDCATLTNLNLVGPLYSRKQKSLRDPAAVKFSLYSIINKCITPFGKRKLRQWVCAPLCNPETITQRQDAIEFLTSCEAQQFVSECLPILRKIPDLERLLQKVHTLGLKYRVDKHPDGRAVMFDMTRYNKRKINDLVNTLEGFRSVVELRNIYLRLKNDAESASTCSVALLEQCFGNGFVDVTADLDHFKESFKQEDALRDGIIVPRKGIDQDYDSICESVSKCIDNLNNYLKDVRKDIKCSTVSYTGTGKNRFTLEIPEKNCGTLNHEYELKSQRKGYRRYTTARSERLFGALLKAEEERDKIRLDLLRRVFADFDTRKNKWAAVLQIVGTFDCLLSLSQYAKSSGMAMTRPQIDFESDEVFLEIEEGYHPSLALLMSSSGSQTYIPNSTVLGGNNALNIVLTGPNMGGKSTLMRQVAVLVVLAQMGCPVPAARMRFSPVDRIFTRIGANDRIMAGQSTFFVEMSEASTIVRGATKHSLVIIDELGRGTSTDEGSAYASVILKYISRVVQCRCFFSTHYGSLCSEVEFEKNVTFSHMACMVENDDTIDPTLANVTFLYKLVPGRCPKSYGFFAAKLAGIDAEIVKDAYLASQCHEVGKSAIMESLRTLRCAANNSSVSVNDLIDHIRSL